MIPVFLIVGAVLAGSAAVGLVAAFWDDIKSFLKKALQKVQKVIRGIVYGVKVFIRKLKEGVKEISRHYSKVDEHWEETTVTRTVPESEIPPEFLKRAEYEEELDITDELEMELSA